MAEYGRSGDDQTRDRGSSRLGRETGDSLGDNRRDERGSGRGWSERDRSGEKSRGGGMFGSSSGGGDDWSQGRREQLGWGSADHSGGGREQGRGGGDRSPRDREEQGWGRSDRPSGGRDDQGWGRSDRSDRDRSHSHGREENGWFGGGGRSESDDQRREREFGYDDRHEGLPINETSRLIASNKVEGTAVYARDGGRLGSIYNFMVDKRSGKAEYAVMSYGGFLGMGTRYYPMPWDLLEYDTRLGGYRVDMLERDLERAPSFDRDSEPSFDTSYGRRVRGWYGLGA